MRERRIKTIALFGAGQTGAMVLRLLGTDYRALCFADNSESRQGTRLLGLPVLSPEESLGLSPELFCLCVLDGQRGDAMEKQLRALGYSGEIIRPTALELFDPRCASLRLLAEQLNEYKVPGDAAELGVFRGDFAALINAAFPDRPLHLFDTFRGFADADVKLERERGFSRADAGDFSQPSVSAVLEKLPFPHQAQVYPGYFPETFPREKSLGFAFVSIDADLYAPTAAALPLFWDRLSKGGILMVHDYNSSQFPGVGEAVREFCAPRGLLPLPLCDLHGSAVLRK